jgi:hypothetical protein
MKNAIRITRVQLTTWDVSYFCTVYIHYIDYTDVEASIITQGQEY